MLQNIKFERLEMQENFFKKLSEINAANIEQAQKLKQKSKPQQKNKIFNKVVLLPTKCQGMFGLVGNLI